MYKNHVLFKSRGLKEFFIDALQGNKLIFKRWDDSKGIRDVLKGNRIDGKRIDGKRIDGKRIDGKRIDGKRIDGKRIDGIIITGSEYFVKDEGSAIIDEGILTSNIPILAMCYGFHYLVYRYGEPSFIKSSNCKMVYSRSFRITKPFHIPKNIYSFWHKDYVVKVPKGFKVIKKMGEKIIIAYNSKKNILAVQFYLYKYKKAVKIFFNHWIAKCVVPKATKPQAP
jgi:GMP synthase-like glutamine amidotransferase